jgi:hypothetical protein
MSKKSYTVHRAMHCDGKDYARGDVREMSETDAAALVGLGALSEVGTHPVTRDPAVLHTFGTQPSEVTERGYTTATGKGVVMGVSAAEQPRKPTDKLVSPTAEDRLAEAVVETPVATRSPTRKG